MNDGDAGIYEEFAREEAADRRRLRAGLGAALVVHVVLILAPLPWDGEKLAVTLPATTREAFVLSSLSFAPPEPPAPVPVPAEAPPEPFDPGPPPAAQAEVLVAPGPATGLVPPQPLLTPPPESPQALWRRGLGAEVLLTVIVDTFGEVAEVEVEAIRALAAPLATGSEDNAATRDEVPTPDPEVDGPPGEGGGSVTVGLDAADRMLYAETAMEVVRRWRFMPATLSGNPLSAGIGVRIVFPPAPAPTPAQVDPPAGSVQPGPAAEPPL